MLFIKMVVTNDGQTMTSEDGVTFEDVYKCAANGEPVMLFMAAVDEDGVTTIAHYPLVNAVYSPAEGESPAEIAAAFRMGSTTGTFTGQPGQVLSLTYS